MCIRNHHLTFLRGRLIWIVLGTCYTCTFLQFYYTWYTFQRTRPLRGPFSSYGIPYDKKWPNEKIFHSHNSQKSYHDTNLLPFFDINKYLHIWPFLWFIKETLVCQKTNIINDVYIPKKTFYNSGSDYSQYKM